MTPPEFIRSIYGAMLDNGIPMAEIDLMEFGLYMQILRERAARRGEDGSRRQADAGDGRDENVVLLHRGTIDEIW